MSLGLRAARLLAALALAVQLALPAVAFAAFSGPGASRVPVCTAAGIVWMDLTSHQGAPAPGAGDTTVHCPLCLAQGAPALPAQAVSMAIPWPLVAERPWLVAAVPPPPAVAWTPHRSRAPPVPA